jgi:hypothetical protein
MKLLPSKVAAALFPSDPAMADVATRRHEVIRETSVMVLYLSVVLLAALSVLPDDYGQRVAEGRHGGPTVLVIVWGTTVGLALAHWFAFRLATSALGDGKPSRHDVSLGVAQVLGAGVVAVVTTVAVVLAPPESEVGAAMFVPAAFIGIAGFGVARAAGRSNGRSLAFGVVVLVIGLLVAALKAWLAGH